MVCCFWPAIDHLHVGKLLAGRGERRGAAAAYKHAGVDKELLQARLVRVRVRVGVRVGVGVRVRVRVRVKGKG